MAAAYSWFRWCQILFLALIKIMQVHPNNLFYAYFPKLPVFGIIIQFELKLSCNINVSYEESIIVQHARVELYLRPHKFLHQHPHRMVFKHISKVSC